MKEKILIVDDDKDFRAELRDCLAEYEIYESANGREALNSLKKAHDIDLIILDVKMPGLSGLEVLSEVRKEDGDVGVIMLTGHGTKETVMEALREHADDYIEKPPDPDELRGIVERILDRKRAHVMMDAAEGFEKVEKIKRFVKRNCFKKTGLKEAGQAVHLSPKYLSRFFKEQSGENFVDYRMKIKMSKAKELLRKGESNISQIAYKLGYENPESFIRQFKKHAQTTPSQYRGSQKAGFSRAIQSRGRCKPKSKNKGFF